MSSKITTKKYPPAKISSKSSERINAIDKMSIRELKNEFKKLVLAQNSGNFSGYQLNGLTGIGGGNTEAMSLPYTLSNSNNYVPITLDRILLTFAYMTHGIFQTAVDQPVYDAFKGGLVISSPELDQDEDIPTLLKYLRDTKVLHEIIDAIRWARLFGGAGLIINTPQDILKQGEMNPLSYQFMDYPDIPLSFVAADRWELTMSQANFMNVPFPYNYYGTPLPEDRVLRIIGKEAPSFIRPQLGGWGFSELERMIRDLNSYVRAQQSLFQILKEANIDVWRLLGFNDAILSDLAQGKINKRIMYANYLKGTYNSIMMDKDDEFEQRTQTFAGWADVLQQIRIGICSALRMPMSKVFGQSANGLQADQDDLENYNAMVESEIREPNLPLIHQVIEMCCRQLFGFAPELTIEFEPLRELSAVEEEEVKTSKQTRYYQLYTAGLLNPQEMADLCKKENLQTMDTLVLHGADPEPPMLQMEEETTSPEGKSKTTKKDKL